MKDRSLTLLIAGVVVVVLGVLMFRAYVEPEKEPEKAVAPVVEQKGEPRRTSAWAILRECGKSNNRIEARGYIENTGNVDLNYVKVKVIWMNKYGLVLEENEMYALNNEILAPGETKNFTDVTERSSVTQCNVEPLDFW